MHTLVIAFAMTYSGGEECLANGHPVYYTTPAGKQTTWDLINSEQWAREVYDQLKSQTEKYADRGPEWLTSRLRMYWNSHSKDVFVKGDFYERAGGEKAPCPTVMYTGARSHATNYARPKLEELAPYEEDPRGIYLANKTIEGNPKEWVPIAKTGTIIQSLNVEILGIARDAAFIWWLTGEEKYGELAESVFDTYMKGIYHRNVPIDLNHGHQQTLVGMSTFEVIHEDALNALVPLYDFIYDRLTKNHRKDIPVYEGAFKKWADNIIDNGVPHNNWDLIQARFIMDIALILEDNEAYEDLKGKQYYMDYVVNNSSIRQWSLKKLADYGFDNKTGIWAECPGYSQGVVNDYASFVELFDRNTNHDLTLDIPVIRDAVCSLPEYLFPNKTIVGFGDTHPGHLRTDGIIKMIANAQRHGRRDDEENFTKLLKLLQPSTDNTTDKRSSVKVAVASFFADRPTDIDKDIIPGEIDDYVSPLFYAPNVSWVAQRNGMRQSSLMASLCGSEGNHMHANGISMELYGKGLILAPDAGIGKSLYSGLDYLEYYSQFPAHNTVCVDGISSYPVMKSNHPFNLTACFPEVRGKGYVPLSFTSIDFIEPETMADQNRLTAIIETGSSSGYYIDVFRSRRKDGKDKTHDYFYHNLGQSMHLTDTYGNEFDLKSTEELAFAGAHLYAYSYLYNKKSVKTDKNIKTVFSITMPDNTLVEMNMWMKGEQEREIFSALSPMTEGLTRTPGMPYNVAEQPTMTYVARQYGEAWERPFVSVFEPTSSKEPGTIESVSFPTPENDDKNSAVIKVTHSIGLNDIIISSDDNTKETIYDGLKAKATYTVMREDKHDISMILIGNGTAMSKDDIRISSDIPANILLRKVDNRWEYRSTGYFKLCIKDKTYEITPSAVFKTVG